VPAVSAATFQVLSTGSPVDNGHRLASYDTLLVVSGGVNRGRRRRNVYDKKPRRYAKECKDNKTSHLTARSDKSVSYVTNNKILLRFVLIKLTTDKYEASRGLFVTAELIVNTYCRVMRGVSRHAVSVCPSVTFVDCVKTNKHIFKFFFTTG